MESGAIAGHSHPASKSLTRIQSLPLTPHPKTVDVCVSCCCSLIAVVFGPHFKCNWAYRLYISAGNWGLRCPRHRVKLLWCFPSECGGGHLYSDAVLNACFIAKRMKKKPMQKKKRRETLTAEVIEFTGVVFLFNLNQSSMFEFCECNCLLWRFIWSQ